MLTQLTIRNFKGLKEADIELGQNVVFIGPNNSGKTTALQALALWYAGIERWGWRLTDWLIDPLDYPSVTLNRLDLIYLPVPYLDLLWNGLAYTKNDDEIAVEITVQGITHGKTWSQVLAFKYVNSESFECFQRLPADLAAAGGTPRITFLYPMSGLTMVEDKLELGGIQRRIGEGRTAEVLRNLCHQLYESNGQNGFWDKLVSYISDLFGAKLLPPNYLPARGEIRMEYQERGGIKLDLSSSGRGMLQVMLLLAYLYANPGTVLLLDEPDAHLEIIRQREIYHLLTEIAREQGSQIIAASHSEVVLEEAAELDTAIAFVGKPHRIDKRNKSQVAKALRDIRAVDYYLAERNGWVLYLEGSTDLAILQTFAKRLNHKVTSWLDEAFVHYLDINKPSKASDHFQGLREAKPDLVGIALFDRIAAGKLQRHTALTQLAWRRREIENYLFLPDALLAYAQQNGDNFAQTMQEIIGLLVPPIALNNPHDKWWVDTKASDDFLDRLFDLYFERLNLPNLMRKTNYHILANYVPVEQTDPEVIEKLDAIIEVAKQAKPRVN